MNLIRRLSYPVTYEDPSRESLPQMSCQQVAHRYRTPCRYAPRGACAGDDDCDPIVRKEGCVMSESVEMPVRNRRHTVFHAGPGSVVPFG